MTTPVITVYWFHVYFVPDNSLPKQDQIPATLPAVTREKRFVFSAISVLLSEAVIHVFQYYSRGHSHADL